MLPGKSKLEITVSTIGDINNTIIDANTYHTEFYIREYKGVLSELTIIPYKR